MSNVFEPVRIKGKLFGKNVATGVIAPKDMIRHIQLLNAEKNGEVLLVSATGRVSRMPMAQAGVTPAPQKMSFMLRKYLSRRLRFIIKVTRQQCRLAFRF